MTASATARNRGFCRSTPAKRWLPLMVGKLNLSIDKTEVGALDHGQEPDHHLLQTFQHSGKLFQAFTATQLLDIVDDDLDPQPPLALIVHLKSQFTEVQLEDRQVVNGAFQDFLQPPAPSSCFVGTTFATEDGFESRHIQ